MRIKNILSFSMLFAAILSSCSDIADDERFIKGEPVISSGRNVLIEDFTGQNCLNCPLAMAEIDKMHETFGEKVIAVGIYGGPFGKTLAGKYYPLTTELGDYYNTRQNIQEQPNGYINRKVLTSNYVTWSGIVTDMLAENAVVGIRCNNDYDSDTRQATISVTTMAIESVADTRLQVWLVEDNVTDMQRQPDGSMDRQFIHNHVLRQSVSDRDGDPVSVVKDGVVEKSYTITIDEAYKAEDLYVVAFVFSQSGVEQVIKEKLIKTVAE